MNARRTIAGLALTLVAVTGCSETGTEAAVEGAGDRARDEVNSAVEDADLPKVDWDKYSGDLQERIDNLAADVDCSALEDELAKMENNDTEVTEYIKAQIERLDC